MNLIGIYFLLCSPFVFGFGAAFIIHLVQCKRRGISWDSEKIATAGNNRLAMTKNEGAKKK